jgi:hypothetical protein
MRSSINRTPTRPDIHSAGYGGASILAPDCSIVVQKALAFVTFHCETIAAPQSGPWKDGRMQPSSRGPVLFGSLP